MDRELSAAEAAELDQLFTTLGQRIIEDPTAIGNRDRTGGPALAVASRDALAEAARKAIAELQPELRLGEGRTFQAPKLLEIGRAFFAKIEEAAHAMVCDSDDPLHKNWDALLQSGLAVAGGAIGAALAGPLGATVGAAVGDIVVRIAARGAEATLCERWHVGAVTGKLVAPA